VAGETNPINRCQVCNPIQSRTTFSNQPDGTTCDDGRFCTVGDTCQGGFCQQGSPRDCSAAGNQCNTGICDENLNRCVAQPVANGTQCNDNNACTRTDNCQAGVCVGSNPVVCQPLDRCHVAGVCNPSTGECSVVAAPDGTPCNADNNACTINDTCQGGSCVAGDAVICPAPPDACHTAGTCDPATGGCSEPTLSVGSCKSGKIKSGPCDCDGTCCPTGSNCVGKPGERRCKEK
jgi:hypothetical protein